ncbi:unnamed protein product [Larinioides sclopetarius]|uniref:Glutaredoxin domain-containing protein n=1 Tax=Larinioides sclopetarius TaxID=280406 RepID=A0AAV2BDW9_9ARAC
MALRMLIGSRNTAINSMLFTTCRLYCSSVKDKIDNLVKKSKVVIFMKGIPENPRCGFSNAVVQILRMHGVEYDSYDVLEDENIRQEKLNHDNYDQWSRDMKYVLMERGLWKIVNGTEKAPKDAVPKTGTDESPELSKAILDYETRSNIAVSLIYLNIETSYRKIVENCEDPVTIWTELRRQFMPDSRSHHMRLFSELVECRILPDESIKEFSNWPTIPQIFINGEFVGGCDILLQMHQNGELIEELKKVNITSALLKNENTQ